MPDPKRLLLDPRGELRKDSRAVERFSFEEYEALEPFLQALVATADPAAALVDGRALSTREKEAFWSGGDQGESSSSLSLYLVAVDDRDEGLSWLASGADDFIVLPERLGELERRLEALVRRTRKTADVSSRGPWGGPPGKRFLRRLAHDLKNPLNGIFGYAELLLMDQSLGKQARLDVGKILRNANFLLRIVEEMGTEAAAREILEPAEGV